jgi:hypothetical protein
MLLFGKFEKSVLITGMLSFNFKYNDSDPVYHTGTTCVFRRDMRVAIGTASLYYPLSSIISDIKKSGSFINPWIESPFKWITDPDDKFVNDTMISRTKLRISMFPTWVQKMINYNA